MIPVTVPIRSSDPDVLPGTVDGFVSFVESPLAVAPAMHFREVERDWVPTGAGWRVVHRATGFHLGGDHAWPTAEEAMAVLDRCDPRFPAWAAIQAGVVDAALVACRLLFRTAVGNR